MRKLFLTVLSVLFVISSSSFATICDEFDNPAFNIYDIANIKVAHANFIEYRLRKSHPQFFNATGQKIRIKYVVMELESSGAKEYAGYVNLKEMLDAYGTKTSYTVHLMPDRSEEKFKKTVAHEIGHLLNFLCIVRKLEDRYKGESAGLTMARIALKLQVEYTSDISKSHDDRHAEQIADAFKDYVFGGKAMSEEFAGEFCLDASGY